MVVKFEKLGAYQYKKSCDDSLIINGNSPIIDGKIVPMTEN